MKSFKTTGICARKINYDVNEKGILTSVEFVGGCPGNAKGVAKLLTGMPIDEVIKKMEGITCRYGTSCPDQLAKALKQYKADLNNN